MKKLLYLLCLLGFLQASAQLPETLSPDAEVSLLTCTPGADLYSLFGHSALRIRDPQIGMDIVYNYGMFSYSDDFYVNFAMGELNYRLGIQDFPNFMAEYIHDQRGVTEQVLNLDPGEVHEIYTFLNWNFLPENRVYKYDYFYNNCSSKLADILEDKLGEKLEWKDLAEPSQPSFRNIIDRYLIYHPWGDFGIDLGLGLPCDVVPTSREYVFLPEKLLEAYDVATVNGKPLVLRKHELTEAKGLTYQWSLFDPTPLFWLIFGIIAVISALGWKYKRLFKALDVFLFVSLGALGALIFFLWFISAHDAGANNFNMLWAWPTHILAIPLLFFAKPRKAYWTAYGVVLILALVSFPFLPQMLHLATIPIMLAMLLRAFVNVRLETTS